MTDPLGVEPQSLRATAEQLTSLSASMKQALSVLYGQVDGAGAVWGNDPFGDNFAKVPGGYLEQKQNVQQSVDLKLKLLDDYASSMTITANTLEKQDES